VACSKSALEAGKLVGMFEHVLVGKCEQVAGSKSEPCEVDKLVHIPEPVHKLVLVQHKQAPERRLAQVQHKQVPEHIRVQVHRQVLVHRLVLEHKQEPAVGKQDHKLPAGTWGDTARRVGTLFVEDEECKLACNKTVPEHNDAFSNSFQCGKRQPNWSSSTC
jgi:hypothetical protein